MHAWDVRGTCVGRAWGVRGARDDAHSCTPPPRSVPPYLSSTIRGPRQAGDARRGYAQRHRGNHATNVAQDEALHEAHGGNVCATRQIPHPRRRGYVLVLCTPGARAGVRACARHVSCAHTFTTACARLRTIRTFLRSVRAVCWLWPPVRPGCAPLRVRVRVCVTAFRMCACWLVCVPFPVCSSRHVPCTPLLTHTNAHARALSMANPGAAKYANWLGVLRWSLAYNDGTRPSEWKPMSEDDQKFLQRVMDSMTVDEAARMEDIATVLLRSPADIMPPAAGAAADTAVAKAASVEGAEEEDDDKPKLPPMPPSMHALLTQKLDMLEELTDIVDSIDNAKNLFIVGAFQPLLLTLYDPLALTVPPSYARTAPRLSAGCASDAASSETTSAGAGVSAARYGRSWAARSV
ncbi:hypothetical protein EON67_00530, partial [archaeon]